MTPPWDALLLVSFGGPEGPEDVLPFLRNVTRGRGIPDERLAGVAEHYHHFGGVSPINQHNRDLRAALAEQLQLPIYWGNLHWEPYVGDAVAQMTADGVRHAAAFVTSAFGSGPGCQRYRAAIARAAEDCGESAPRIEKLPLFGNHPGFLEAVTEQTRPSLEEARKLSPAPLVLFTAHSIPQAAADASNYEAQLLEACQGVCDRLEVGNWRLVWQSRSGPPSQPWLAPDICDVVAEADGPVVVVPIGFVSDHVEVLWDLDNEAAEVAKENNIPFFRAPCVGTHPTFVDMICGQVSQPLDETSGPPCGPDPDRCLCRQVP